MEKKLSWTVHEKFQSLGGENRSHEKAMKLSNNYMYQSLYTMKWSWNITFMDIYQNHVTVGHAYI